MLHLQELNSRNGELVNNTLGHIELFWTRITALSRFLVQCGLSLIQKFLTDKLSKSCILIVRLEISMNAVLLKTIICLCTLAMIHIANLKDARNCFCQSKVLRLSTDVKCPSFEPKNKTHWQKKKKKNQWKITDFHTFHERNWICLVFKTLKNHSSQEFYSDFPC